MIGMIKWSAMGSGLVVVLVGGLIIAMYLPIFELGAVVGG